MMTSDVRVFVEIDGQPVHAGHLYSHRRRRAESASFSYAETYLAAPDAYELDPGLPLQSGNQQTPERLKLFRAFADSSPDRWGRHLIVRAERLRATQASTAGRRFGEFDLLLGVRDDLRQGALRFRAEDSETYLAAADTGVPQLTDLPSLLRATDRFGADEAGPADLAVLLRAESSLGGARPKAHVRTASGALAIAKFPAPASDRWNVMTWEKTTLDLAHAAGIVVPRSQLVKVSGRDVLVVDRFDRDGPRRIGYASAMTMLEAAAGDGSSYQDIAGVIEEHSAVATAELQQLWRRIAFSVLVSNTDDHLRNHGFVHVAGDTWSLSPAFDLNPDPDPGEKYLATAIEGDDTTASIELALEVAPYFRLTPVAARVALREVVAAQRQWETVAARHGLTRRAIQDMAPAFGRSDAGQDRQRRRHTPRCRNGVPFDRWPPHQTAGSGGWRRPARRASRELLDEGGARPVRRLSAEAARVELLVDVRRGPSALRC